MNTRCNKVLGLSFIIFIFLATVVSKRNNTVSSYEQPAVVKAVAPAFIPFVFGKTGNASVVVEVKINEEGDVISAHIVEASLFRDNSFEETAKRWKFAPATNGVKERTARLTFLLRIMPKGTSAEELTTIFTLPYQVEIKHEVFEPTSDPNPPNVPRRKKP